MKKKEDGCPPLSEVCNRCKPRRDAIIRILIQHYLVIIENYIIASLAGISLMGRQLHNYSPPIPPMNEYLHVLN
jgi:hypothetical protein